MSDRHGREKNQDEATRIAVSSIQYNTRHLTVGDAMKNIHIGGLLPKTATFVREMCDVAKRLYKDEQILSSTDGPIDDVHRLTRVIRLPDNVALRGFPLDVSPLHITVTVSVTDEGFVTMRAWPFAYLCGFDGNRGTPDLKTVKTPLDKIFELGMLPERLMYVPLMEGISNSHDVYRSRGMGSEVREKVFETLEQVEREMQVIE